MMQCVPGIQYYFSFDASPDALKFVQYSDVENWDLQDTLGHLQPPSTSLFMSRNMMLGMLAIAYTHLHCIVTSYIESGLYI